MPPRYQPLNFMQNAAARLRSTMSPPIIKPAPLTVWGHVWRWTVALVIGVFASLMIIGLHVSTSSEEVPGFVRLDDRAMAIFITVDVIAGIIAFVCMGLRRKFPRTAGTISALTASLTAFGSIANMITLISVAARRQWREIVPISLLWIGSALVVEGYYFGKYLPGLSSSWVGVLSSTTGLVGIALAIGVAIGSRRETLANQRSQLMFLQETREAREQEARVAERARIAREMHDVLAHRISLVSLHSGALAYRTDLTPEQVRETAQLIRDNSHQALSELRQVLGVLRDPNSLDMDGPPDAPQPTLTMINSLIGDAQAAGASITLNVTPELAGQLDNLLDATSRNVYRVLQECLTNARKHAPAETVSVSMYRPADGPLTLEVANALPTTENEVPAVPGSGLGLVGMAERVRSSGGMLSSGKIGGLFFVFAEFPWIEKDDK